MKVYKNLTIIGSSHIAKESILHVKEFISKNKPEIIALELDRKRFIALFDKRKPSLRDIGEIGFWGFLINLIGAYIEKKLGKLVGVSPGSEMKMAVSLAKDYNAKIALIDQDIEVTLKKFSKSLSWKEKWNFLVDIIKAIFVRKNIIEFDLTKVPDKKTIKKLVRNVKERYPNVYKVLVEERNHVMANNLKKIYESLN